MTAIASRTTATFTDMLAGPAQPAGNNWKVQPLANGDICVSSPEMRVTVSKRDGGQVKWETLAHDGSVTAEGLSTGDPHDSARRAGETGPGQRFDTSGDQSITIPEPAPSGTTLLLKRVTGDNKTPVPGQKEPTFNGEVMVGNDRDGIVSVKNLHAEGPLQMGESYPNYPGLSDTIFSGSVANKMVFDPIKGRMLDPQTGQEIDQVRVDRNDLVRGGVPAIQRALAQGGAFFSLTAGQAIWQEMQFWTQVDPNQLSWLRESSQQARKQSQEQARNEARLRNAWSLNRFVPMPAGAPVIPMPRMSDCPNNRVSPLSFALSEIGGQVVATNLHQQLMSGVDRIAFFQDNYRGSTTYFQFG
jgi:hypothetical protein